jgi:hypothetical protein
VNNGARGASGIITQPAFDRTRISARFLLRRRQRFGDGFDWEYRALIPPARNVTARYDRALTFISRLRLSVSQILNQLALTFRSSRLWTLPGKGGVALAAEYPFRKIVASNCCLS